MKIESVPIDSITLDPQNARVHNARNIEAIQKSLARFGQQKPVVVDRDNIIRAGNGTVVAARALGWKKIVIVRTTLTGPAATAYGIADNRLNELSEWDPVQLSALLDEIAEDGLGEITGFDAAEVEALLNASDVIPIRGAPPSLSNAPGLRAAKCVVIVDCADEAEQAQLLTDFEERGLLCRALML